MTFRIGHGYDVHAFCDGDHLMLAGIRVPYEHSVIAHSDGDVVIHALCDALLGALALGDIGDHFPDTEARYKNVSSTILLKEVYELINHQGFSLINADITVIAQVPKIAPYKHQMRLHIAHTLGLTIDAISIKATTTEKLGFIGRREGISACAVALLAKHTLVSQ